MQPMPAHEAYMRDAKDTLADWSRLDMQRWLKNNDRNGEWSDEDADRNGWPRMTDDELRQAVLDMVASLA